jgi:hypothetical protein
MFFHSGWVVGKILDLVAEAGKIENKNNKAVDDSEVRRRKIYSFL